MITSEIVLMQHQCCLLVTDDHFGMNLSTNVHKLHALVLILYSKVRHSCETCGHRGAVIYNLRKSELNQTLLLYK